MITYDGVTLENVAPVKIEDIRVSPIQYSAVARERAIRGGSEFIRMRDGTRTVSISFAVLENNLEVRQQYLAAIDAWAKSDAEHKLLLPQVPNRYLMCVCTKKPEPSTRQWWEAKLKIVFTCYDNPYWNDLFERSVACGTAFKVLGDALPLMRIEASRGSAGSNQTYSNGSESMTFSSIPAGNMVIDLNKQTAVVGSTSFMGNYAYTSKFVQPKLGTQTITGTGTVKYRERWE